MRHETTPEPAKAAELTREVWLRGQPSLSSYLSYCESAVPGAPVDRHALAAEWLEANLAYEALAESEAGIAETVETRDLEAELQPLAAEVAADPRFRETFTLAPTRFAWVELDKLIAPQRHIDLGQVERHKARLAGLASAADLFRFALPLDRREAPVEIRNHGPGHFVFTSKSADFRFHRGSLLSGAQLSGYAGPGVAVAALGLFVGFTGNFFSVLESAGRLVIHDGHHRAYALRAAGHTHAPCIVQTVTHREELALVATGTVANAPMLYFRSPRPPLLKDFFNPALNKEMLVRKVAQVVEIEFKVREFEAADAQSVG